MKFGPMRGGEVHEGQDILLGLIHEGGQFGMGHLQLIYDLTPLGFGCGLGVLGEDRSDDAAMSRRPFLPPWAGSNRL